MVFKDLEMLQEAYFLMEKKHVCHPAAKGCKCDGCKECKANSKKKAVKEAKEDKPDYLDADEDGDKKESMKKALSDKGKKKEEKVKESLSSFKDLFRQVMAEDRKMSFGPSAHSNTFEHDKKVWMLRKLSNGEINEINEDEQYDVTWKDEYVKKHNGQKQQPLKGESVLPFLSEIESISRPSFE
jgi:hypothetical protein